jgi:hypothetical protein
MITAIDHAEYDAHAYLTLSLPEQSLRQHFLSPPIVPLSTALARSQTRGSFTLDFVEDSRDGICHIAFVTTLLSKGSRWSFPAVISCRQQQSVPYRSVT